MRILSTAWVAAIVLAVAPVASVAAAAGLVAGPPIAHSWGAGQRHLAWRGHDRAWGGDGVAWRGHGDGHHDGGERRGHRQPDVFAPIGPVWPILESPAEATSAGTPQPLSVAAPLTVSLTVTTAAAATGLQEWTPSGPRLIKLRGDPPHRRYPLVVYGD